MRLGCLTPDARRTKMAASDGIRVQAAGVGGGPDRPGVGNPPGRGYRSAQPGPGPHHPARDHAARRIHADGGRRARGHGVARRPRLSPRRTGRDHRPLQRAGRHGDERGHRRSGRRRRLRPRHHFEHALDAGGGQRQPRGSGEACLCARRGSVRIGRRPRSGAAAQAPTAHGGAGLVPAGRDGLRVRAADASLTRRGSASRGTRPNRTRSRSSKRAAPPRNAWD